MIELPFPHKALWPNGRAHWGTKASETKKARSWAKGATLADKTRPPTVARIVATFYPQATGPFPDEDNCVAALKSTIDGIADAYKVNDATFPAPVIRFGERVKGGKLVVVIE